MSRYPTHTRHAALASVALLSALAIAGCDPAGSTRTVGAGLGGLDPSAAEVPDGDGDGSTSGTTDTGPAPLLDLGSDDDSTSTGDTTGDTTGDGPTSSTGETETTSEPEPEAAPEPEPEPEPCPVGSSGCACTLGLGCDPGLTCCDGSCVVPEQPMPPPPSVGVESLEPGDLVITELMYDPNKSACAEPGCEWFEVFNATGSWVELGGLMVRDSADDWATQGIVSAGLVGPGEYAWIGGSAAGWPYTEQPTAYAGAPALNNAQPDSLAIWNANGLIDATAAYTTHGAADNGVSWQLVGPPSAVANDLASAWCWSSVVFDVDLGSPGEPSTACNQNL